MKALESLEAEVKRLKERILECGGEVFFGDICLEEGEGYLGNSGKPIVSARPFSEMEDIRIRAVKVDKIGNLFIIGENMDGDIIDPVEWFDIEEGEFNVIHDAIIIEEKTVWMRLGVTVKGSKEEIEEILENGAETGETLWNLLDGKCFEIEGESYIPASVIEEYNKENGTDVEEKDIEFAF